MHSVILLRAYTWKTPGRRATTITNVLVLAHPSDLSLV